MSAESGISAGRSLPVDGWPDADRRAWEEACRPGCRLKPGGVASHLGQVTREQMARGYGGFLAFLQRNALLDRHAAAAAQVTLANIAAYITDLAARVRSVTIYSYMKNIRLAASLLAPTADFSWLAEAEKDVALVMQPKSKFDRLVFTGRLLEAGLTLVAEARQFRKNDIAFARGVRNGLMIALLALCPVRLKNFAALEIGHTFRQVNGTWWIALPSASTKSRRPDERPVPDLLDSRIDIYLNQARPILLRSRPTNALWISPRTGAMTKKNVGQLISRVTFETLGIDVSPHLFRTAAASTAAAYGGATPHLASALLNHKDPRVTEEHYTRATSISASRTYTEIINGYLKG